MTIRTSQNFRDSDKFDAKITAVSGILQHLLTFFRTFSEMVGDLNKRSGLAEVAREEGVLGFYRGVGSPLASLTILNSLNFSSYASPPG